TVIDPVFQNQRRYSFSVWISDRFIIFIYHMEDHVEVVRIVLMTMPSPIRRPDMHFHLSGPQLSSDTQSGICKIRTLIPVQNTGLDDVKTFAGRTKKILMIIFLSSPYV